jgi:hypothetical protein
MNSDFKKWSATPVNLFTRVVVGLLSSVNNFMQRSSVIRRPSSVLNFKHTL